MHRVTTVPVIDSPKVNPYKGFNLLSPYEQDKLLNEQLDQKLLCLDPRKGLVIISISIRSMLTVLNPITSSGTTLFFVNPDLAQQFIEAREKWFIEKKAPVDDVCIYIGKWCPVNECTCTKK